MSKHWMSELPELAGYYRVDVAGWSTKGLLHAEYDGKHWILGEEFDHFRDPTSGILPVMHWYDV
jgi:hypothetical protein